MTLFNFLLASLRFHFRLHLAVALGVAVATSVLVGALLVGDSMRGSLRHLALDRLGPIQELLISDRFFRTALADELKAEGEFPRSFYHEVLPAIMLPGSTMESTGENRSRASQVMVLGVDDVTRLGFPVDQLQLGPDEIAINAPLAEKLRVQQGDMLNLRFAGGDQVPADSLLSHKDNRTASLAERKLAAIFPAEGIGRFSLHPQQVQPFVAVVPLPALQEALDQADRANALLVTGNDAPEAISAALAKSLQPRLDDFGLHLEPVHISWDHAGNEETIARYWSLTSDRMLIDPEVVDVVSRDLASLSPQPVFTYLANRMERVPTNAEETRAQAQRGPISYSTVCAIDSQPALGPCINEHGELMPPPDENGIYLNSWAAEDQQISQGDRVRLAWFEPETTHGTTRETAAEFTVRGIVPLTEPVNPFSRRRPAAFETRPSLANDPHLTPAVKGVTDQDAIDTWDAPFPLDLKLVRSQDDSYWENHRTTPKAFVSLAAGQRLWGSRWGNVTSIRFPHVAESDADQIASRLLQALRDRQVTLGLEFQPIRRRDLRSASGTTPFDGLFLGLSFFIVAAALLLVVLLFRLGLEQRASELGLLLGLGWSRRRMGGYFLAEAAVVAFCGALAGAAGGVGYAWLMLAGLRSWWLGAIATPFLELHVTFTSVALGVFAGLFTSLGAIGASLYFSRHVPVRQLLLGRLDDTAAPLTTGIQLPGWVPLTSLTVAIVLALLAPQLGGELQAATFLGAGSMILTATVAFLYQQLRAGGTLLALSGSSSLLRLAFRNAARQPVRSLLTLSLVASAVFLIVSLSAFRLSPGLRGSGGFALVATSARPLLVDLNDPDRQQELLADESKLMNGASVMAFRVRAGDDASCRNLYRPLQPRVVSMPREFISHFDQTTSHPFEWAMSAADSVIEKQNPWQMLSSSSTRPGEAVPVVLDRNTAMFSLQLYRGVGEEFTITYATGSTIRFRVAGLLLNSVFQGSLLVGEADFRRLFPEVSGHSYFLIQPGSTGDARELSRVLEDRLADEGFEIRSARDVLADLLAVQNTYISAFQTLGALGLVLGTFGVAAVQLRSIWERKSELGLLRAIGFSLARVTRLILLENLALLLGGLLLGTLAALAAVLPHMLAGGASVPWMQLASMLVLVVATGLAVSWWTTRAVVRLPLLSALRGE